VRLIEFGAQLRDGCTQTFELGALLVTQFDAPIPSLIGLSHQPVFAARPDGPAWGISMSAPAKKHAAPSAVVQLAAARSTTEPVDGTT